MRALTTATTPGSTGGGGFTVIEMMIAVMALAVMLSVLGVVSMTGRSAYEQTSVLNELDARGARAVVRVADELATISGSQMLPSPAGNTGTQRLDFVQAFGVAAGAPVWGPPTRIAAEYETGEVDDGLDNDGDGLVDERMLVLTRDLGSGSEKRVVLANGLAEWGQGEVPNNGVDDNANGVVDEQGFNLHQVGDVISIRMWLQKVGSDNQLVTREIQNTVRLRNAGV
jgi:hypothetical protein